MNQTTRSALVIKKGGVSQLDQIKPFKADNPSESTNQTTWNKPTVSNMNIAESDRNYPARLFKPTETDMIQLNEMSQLDSTVRPGSNCNWFK